MIYMKDQAGRCLSVNRGRRLCFPINHLDKKLTPRIAVTNITVVVFIGGRHCNLQNEKRVVSVVCMIRDISKATLDRPFVRYAMAVVVVAASLLLP